ncbi:calcium:proton antiporter [Bradyrhizobium erythrophlei]|jgi:Ca2+:H+ antiporter|uniref:Ca2+:H+ antiporter n=1 Tax=Bradyrhizobium erythrophlei TaxID=1437360 RepID=A0A1M7TGR5_9BRAD|nr:ionic transporter y4hA [Bradyrhizobium erythrophlei]SHN69906.1 Ca2+:H+ antiporter [Bradyrhizobium erythrophlei]
MSTHGPMPRSSWVFPLLSVLLFVGVTALHYTFVPSVFGWLFAAALLVILFGTVFAAVHHAEVVAERIGEPFGTLLLTLSVTIIEVALIATIMLGEKAVTTLARDTVFAVVMIVCNGLVGLCILVGGLRYREQDIQASGSSLYLSVLLVLATITLIMPNYTLTTPGPIYSAGQLGFVSVATILLYGVFLYTQTVRHRDYFVADANVDHDGPQASNKTIMLSTALLLISLLAVVLLAKKFSQVVDASAAQIGAPPAFAGILVALLILMPEGVAAIAAARRNNLQKSINLALGSSIATIGLTVPAVAIAAYELDRQLVLGLPPQEMVLLALTLLLAMLTLGSGRTNILFGLVHLVVFAIFMFLVFVP